VQVLKKSMNSIKKVKTKQAVSGDYINSSTGETVLSELPNLAYMVKDTNLVIVDYKNFTVVNQEVMAFLEGVLPFAEIGRINKLSQLIKSNWNILHNSKTNKPYSDSDLAADIQYSRNKFYNFMQKLYKASVVYKLKGYIDGVEQTVILLNPHLAKRSKTINKDVLTYFQDISKPEVQKRISNLIKELK
jgi:hypothetical protein